MAAKRAATEPEQQQQQPEQQQPPPQRRRRQHQQPPPPPQHGAAAAPPSPSDQDLVNTEPQHQLLCWVKLDRQLPWWPAKLAAPVVGGPTVAIEVRGGGGRVEVLRVQRRRIDRDFCGRLGQRSAPWKRRKCAGITRSFGEALAHARQLLGATAHARCALCGRWRPVPGEAVAGGWQCPEDGCCAAGGRRQPREAIRPGT